MQAHDRRDRTPQTLSREDVGRPRRPRRPGRRARPALHRPPPRPRGHLARRPSTACGWRAAACAGPTSPWPPTDHNVPTDRARPPLADPISARQMDVLRRQLRRVRHPALPDGSPGQGIVHVIGPEQGLTQPGMTIVCGDSHTSTHGAFGALAFGIGTSEVEHVLATQTLPQRRPGTMAVTIDGDLPAGRHRQGRDPGRHRAASAPAAAWATSSSTGARPSGRSRWRAA